MHSVSSSSKLSIFTFPYRFGFEVFIWDEEFSLTPKQEQDGISWKKQQLFSLALQRTRNMVALQYGGGGGGVEELFWAWIFFHLMFVPESCFTLDSFTFDLLACSAWISFSTFAVDEFFW